MDLKSKNMKNAMFLIAFGISLMWLLDNLSLFGSILSRILAIISPFMIGASIAFILNSPMMYIEKTFFSDSSPLGKIKGSFKRPLSYLITLIIFVATILIILLIILPELVTTVQDLTVRLPQYWKDLQVFIVKNLIDNPQVTDWINNINVDWVSIEQSVISFFKDSALNWLGSTFSFATSIVGNFITFVVAFIFSIYILFQKEVLLRQLKKVVLAFSSTKTAERIFYLAELSSTTFTNFLSGQLLEAIIIGGLFLVAMTIFRFPYALMISLTIAVTALIPMIGAFIGCIVGAFLILVESPIMAFWFVVMFLIIQQIEGNLIYPHVVGKAAGLPSIWILVAVTVGGSLMGVLGILLFIPIGSIAYTLFKETVHQRLKNKNITEV